MKDQELAPCPCCGNENPTLWPMPNGDKDSRYYSPTCEICGLTIEENIAGENTEDQAYSWNKRADSPKLKAAREALEEVIAWFHPETMEAGHSAKLIVLRCKRALKEMSK